MLAQCRIQRRVMWEGLAAIPGVHAYELQAAFYPWVRYYARLSSVDLMKYLYERGLAVRPGTEFGKCGEQHLRLSFSPAAEIIAAGVQILRSALEELAAEGWRTVTAGQRRIRALGSPPRSGPRTGREEWTCLNQKKPLW